MSFLKVIDKILKLLKGKSDHQMSQPYYESSSINRKAVYETWYKHANFNAKRGIDFAAVIYCFAPQEIEVTISVKERETDGTVKLDYNISNQFLHLLK